MAPCGAIPKRENGRTLPFVAVFHDHHLVVVAPAMIAVPSVVAMMPAVIAMLDHNGLGARNRRRGDGNRAKRGDNVSKFSHFILLH